MKAYHSRLTTSTLVASCVLCFSINAGAIEPISEETGWSGFVLLGGGFTDVKSNTVVGNDIIDVGDDTISSIIQSPQSDDTAHPVVGLELKYTLPGRSQFFLGSSLEDQLTMDFANQLGWRKHVPIAGTLQLGLLLSLPAAEVWADPYLEGVPRREEDRESLGFRLELDNVLGSGLGLLLQTRDIEIDDELSGTDPALRCDTVCQQLLDRNGDQFVARLWYRFILSPNHILEPQVRIRNEDRDGAAIARDAWAAQLSYTYLQPPFTFVGSALYGQSEYDEPNPLYGIRQDADTMALEATLLYALPTQSGRWQLTGSVFLGDSDSDIDFHDNQLTQIAVGLMYNFGGSGTSNQ
ncbi:MAG: DUF2860 family protein [Woeseiaceae bacterium]